MYLDILAKKLEQKKLNDEKKAKLEKMKNEKDEVTRKDEKAKFNEKFGYFYNFIKDMKEQKTNVFSFLLENYKNGNLYINNNEYILASFMGITIAVKPTDIEIIEPLSSSNKIYLAICFTPHESVNYIEETTWSINNVELCSYISQNQKPTVDEDFYIPQKVYFDYYAKKSFRVQKEVASLNSDKYYHGIEIEFNDYSDEYTIKTLRDRVITPIKYELSSTNNKYSFLNMTTSQFMYDSVLDIKIKRDEFLKNEEIIFDDLLRIFIAESKKMEKTKENELLKFENKDKLKFLFKPFDLNEKHWNKPYNFFIDDVITNYPRFIANQLQQSKNICNLSKEFFKYNF